MEKELIIHRIDEALKHIEYVEDDLKDIELENFSGTSLVARATAFSIEQICEHISKLRKDLEPNHPEIPWDKIYDMRIVLAHMYTSVNTRVVYRTAKADLPELEKQLIAMKKEI